jgi:hypothetical protein
MQWELYPLRIDNPRRTENGIIALGVLGDE